MTKISPMKLARDLGIRPQVIYQAIRKGRIPSFNENGKVVIDEATAKERLSVKGKRGRPAIEGGKTQGYAASPRVHAGDLASWGTYSGRRLIQVKDPNNLIVAGRAADGVPVVFRTTSFNTLLAEGKITIEDPIELLHMIQNHFWARKQDGYADAMDELFRYIREHHDPGTIPVPDPEEDSNWSEDTGNTSDREWVLPMS